MGAISINGCVIASDVATPLMRWLHTERTSHAPDSPYDEKVRTFNELMKEIWTQGGDVSDPRQIDYWVTLCEVSGPRSGMFQQDLEQLVKALVYFEQVWETTLKEVMLDPSGNLLILQFSDATETRISTSDDDDEEEDDEEDEIDDFDD